MQLKAAGCWQLSLTIAKIYIRLGWKRLLKSSRIFEQKKLWLSAGITCAGGHLAVRAAREKNVGVCLM